MTKHALAKKRQLRDDGLDRPCRAADVGCGGGRIAIVDIGSNTVRLVVYESPMRLPAPIFNEKIQCELGRGLTATGRLNPVGAKLALTGMQRFVRLAAAMGAAELDLVATAAVREAEDGPEFVARIEKLVGRPVQVLNGDEEVETSAIGLLSGVPDADGVLGDMGGGSLDLMELNHGEMGARGTLPLGHLRLWEDSGGSAVRAFSIAAERLDDLPWLEHMEGRAFYAIGGAWRNAARVFIEQMGYPLHIVDNFQVGLLDALSLTHLISGAGKRTLAGIPGVSHKRLETLPSAAVCLHELLKRGRPERVVFSGFGLREGQLLKSLPEAMRSQDPLISGCFSLAERTGRFSVGGGELMDWLAPVFAGRKAGETEAESRLRLAACLVSDIGWTEHPDYRADHAFYRVLRLPFAGLTHPERAFLAVVIFVRYGGNPDTMIVAPARSLLDDAALARAEQLGLALRLALMLSGSAPGVLDATQLKLKKQKLELVLPEGGATFSSETVERRLRNLARSLGLEGRIR